MKLNKRNGFSLVELLVVVASVSVLFALVSVNFLTARGRADLSTNANTLISEIHTQQIKSMTGDTEGVGDAYEYGIHFDTSSYTLFQGSYTEGAPNNYRVELPDGIEVSVINLPQSEIIFARGDGAIVGFEDTQNSLTVRNSITGEDKSVSFNKHGVITNDF